MNYIVNYGKINSNGQKFVNYLYVIGTFMCVREICKFAFTIRIYRIGNFRK